ncbi:MAG: transporter substrate-binding domain-containing protein [Clostridia bacterium]|nr:transporter substrate-binding domain-containing protein [Clostridia bacterium]
MTIGYTVYAPMNYTDDEGNFVGFDTEFAEAVCAKLGVEPDFVEINWDTKEIELEAKTIDCIWNGFTMTEEREENLDFSVPYILNKQVVVIRKADSAKYTDTASLADARLVAEVASAGETAIADDEELSKATYTAVTKQTDALLEVKSNTADAAVLDYTLANAMVGK